MKFFAALGILALIIFSYAFSSANSVYKIPQKKSGFVFYIYNNHWHTGFVLPNGIVEKNHIEFLNDFDGYEFIDIGWGDSDFYRSKEFEIGMAAKALLWPTESVLRAEGISDSSYHFSLGDFLIEFSADSAQYFKLLELIGSSISEKENLLETSPSGKIRYYVAKGKYHLFNTCNTWMYQILGKAGLIRGNGIIITDDDLFFAVHPFGSVIFCKEFD